MTRYFPLIFLFLFLFSCKKVHQPKPRGYFRIDFPKKDYKLFDSSCNYIFEYPAYAMVMPDDEEDAQACWLNVVYPEFKAKIHLSYKEIITSDDLYPLIEDSREMVYKHTVKADAIKETLIDYPHHVNGILYELKGDAASSVQFFVTDSVDHYVRGALYFRVKSNRDSLDPVIDFIREDIMHLLKTMRWKES